jgi:hypothetical protein
MTVQGSRLLVYVHVLFKLCPACLIRPANFKIFIGWYKNYFCGISRIIHSLWVSVLLYLSARLLPFRFQFIIQNAAHLETEILSLNKRRIIQVINRYMEGLLWNFWIIFNAFVLILNAFCFHWPVALNTQYTPGSVDRTGIKSTNRVTQLFPVEAKDCSLNSSVQTGSGAHPTSYPKGTGGSG